MKHTLFEGTGAPRGIKKKSLSVTRLQKLMEKKAKKKGL